MITVLPHAKFGSPTRYDMNTQRPRMNSVITTYASTLGA